MNINEGYVTFWKIMQHAWDNKQNILELWIRQQLFLLLLMTSIEYTFKNILCLPERNQIKVGEKIWLFIEEIISK